MKWLGPIGEGAKKILSVEGLRLKPFWSFVSRVIVEGVVESNTQHISMFMFYVTALALAE